MLDLDGTTIPNGKDGMPSRKVVEAIKEASKVIHVGVVTGRPYIFAKPITKALGLTGLAVLSGGAQVVDLSTEKILWQKTISLHDTHKICTFLKKIGDAAVIQNRDSFDNAVYISSAPKETLSIAIEDASYLEADKIIHELKKFPAVVAHKIPGWTKNTIWLQISSVEGTKLHGIVHVAKILGIETHDIIGVGDGHNDFPLLMACGLKVAMGNAVEDLKAIADYVAPTVDEDGVAWVIEKFVLRINP